MTLKRRMTRLVTKVRIATEEEEKKLKRERNPRNLLEGEPDPNLTRILTCESDSDLSTESDNDSIISIGSLPSTIRETDTVERKQEKKEKRD